MASESLWLAILWLVSPYQQKLGAPAGVPEPATLQQVQAGYFPGCHVLQIERSGGSPMAKSHVGGREAHGPADLFDCAGECVDTACQVL